MTLLEKKMNPWRNKLDGILWGTAVGDSLGLPAEGISRAGIEALGWKDNWKQRFIGRRGMLSDDTEHMMMLIEALLAHPDDVSAFRRAFASKLRWWLLALPAGVGFATLRSVLKLWFGCPPEKSGVFSAGNGPAMRSAILGAYFAQAPDQLESYVRASTEITHTDPRALVGALAVAYCAATPEDLTLVWERLKALSKLDPEEWPELVELIQRGLGERWTMQEFTRQLGVEKGVSGYVYHTVPVALFAWFRWWGTEDAFEKILIEVLNCGGDTDTTGEIAGALAGAKSGFSGIECTWRDKIFDWPRSGRLIGRYVTCLEKDQVAPKVVWLFAFMRNLLFLLIVLSHGFLRLLPNSIRKARGSRSNDLC